MFNVCIISSIGKEAQNATLFHGVVMCQAIKQFYDKTGYKVHILS